MTFRTVYGYRWSENGWRMVNRDGCVVAGPSMGLPFTSTAPIRRGPASTILVAWLAWYHRNVEPLTSPVWGWSATNTVPNSNHLSGTAVDINAPQYPWGYYRMPAATREKVERGISLFEGTVYWGRRWNKPDEMHYQLGWREGDPRVENFAKKLSAGHLGIYGRPTPPPATEGIGEEAMSPEDRRRLREVWDQLRGPSGKGWPQLGTDDAGRPLTLVDAVAALRAELAELNERLSRE